MQSANGTFSCCICRTGCFRTDSCNGTMVNFTKTSTECCDGFAQEESMDSSLRHHFSFFRNRKSKLRTEGCTISKSSYNISDEWLVV